MRETHLVEDQDIFLQEAPEQKALNSLTNTKTSRNESRENHYSQSTFPANVRLCMRTDYFSRFIDLLPASPGVERRHVVTFSGSDRHFRTSKLIVIRGAVRRKKSVNTHHPARSDMHFITTPLVNHSNIAPTLSRKVVMIVKIDIVAYCQTYDVEQCYSPSHQASSADKRTHR